MTPNTNDARWERLQEEKHTRVHAEEEQMAVARTRQHEEQEQTGIWTAARKQNDRSVLIIILCEWLTFYVYAVCRMALKRAVVYCLRSLGALAHNIELGTWSFRASSHSGFGKQKAFFFVKDFNRWGESSSRCLPQPANPCKTGEEIDRTKCRVKRTCHVSTGGSVTKKSVRVRLETCEPTKCQG